MTVAELEELLATLDKDTVVLIKGCHIDYVSKEGARTWPRAKSRRRCTDCGHGTVTEDEWVDVPPAIDLGYMLDARGRADQPRKVKLHGRWSRVAKALFA